MLCHVDGSLHTLVAIRNTYAAAIRRGEIGFESVKSKFKKYCVFKNIANELQATVAAVELFENAEVEGLLLGLLAVFMSPASSWFL